MTLRAVSPPETLTDLTRRLDNRDASDAVLRETLALLEETAHHVARVTRGMTTATPERRRLREAFEAALFDFIKATSDPAASVVYTQPDATVSLMLAQSMTGAAPAPAGDE